MLRIVIPGEEYYDEENQTFSTVGDSVVVLEHSLVSLSKWEARFEKPFLGPAEKTKEELIGYIEEMILSPENSPEVVSLFTRGNISQIEAYIDSKQSATFFGSMPERKKQHEVITSELIYYWMIGFQIPFECERWHLNRLFSLIRVCNVKQSPKKKMSATAIAQRNRDLNAQRRAALGTSG